MAYGKAQGLSWYCNEINSYISPIKGSRLMRVSRVDAANRIAST